MRGVGRSRGALTVLNALPLGVGCAIGVDLPASVEVVLSREPEHWEYLTPGTNSELVEAAVHAALARFEDSGDRGGRVRVDSHVPIGKGLKSSSAVSSAAIRAVADALGKTPTPEAVAQISAEASRDAGVSVTGAFDDALAGLIDGFVLTDNSRDRLLQQSSAPPDLVAVIYLPEGQHPPGPQVAAALQREQEGARAALEAARGGHWAEAMRRNSELVERALGYDYGVLRRRLEASGAAAVGVSGLGPALGALVPRERVRAVTEALPPEPHLTVELGRGSG